MRKRRRSSSSSVHGSLGDLEDRVIMLCENMPSERSFDSFESQSPEACSSVGSQSEEFELNKERWLSPVNRDKMAYYSEMAHDGTACYYYTQRRIQEYGCSTLLLRVRLLDVNAN